MRTFALVVTLFLLVGCDGYKKDVETVCNVRSRVKIPANAENEGQLIGGYLFENIHSPKAKKVFLSLGTMNNTEKLALLRKEAAATGVSPCPLADEAEAALKANAAAPPPAPAAPAPTPEAAPDAGG
ncbi:MAG: hypothetical protein ABTQ32_06535 [Myxococcaceae bacterium]